MTAADKRIEHLLRQTGTRLHAPNGLRTRLTRWDGLMLECDGGDHVDYLFPVAAESSDPPERGPEGQVLWWNKATHALIYTDGNVALTLHEACHHLWHLRLDGAYLSGPLHGEHWRLSVESLEKISLWCLEHGRGPGESLHPACRYPDFAPKEP